MMNFPHVFLLRRRALQLSPEIPYLAKLAPTSRNLRELIEMDPSPNKKIRLHTNTIFWFPSKRRRPTINTYRWISSITLFRSSSPTWPYPCGWIFTEAGESMNPNFKALGDYLQGESLLGKVQLVTARSRFHTMEISIFRGTSEASNRKMFFFSVFPPFFSWSEVSVRVGFFGTCVETFMFACFKNNGNLQNPKQIIFSKFFSGNRKELHSAVL